MNTKKFLVFFLTILLAIILAGCGTFEIGIESNAVIEPTPLAATETVSPTPTPTLADPTKTPESSAEAEIESTLAARLGFAVGELPFEVTQLAENHAKGNYSQHYFLAARQDGQWVIVYDGQATPPCSEVDFYDFPIGMVPECLGADNQLVFRSGSVSDLSSSLLSLDCGPGSPGAYPGTVESVACNIQDGLRSRNTSALLGYMVDPFTIGYWQSEGISGAPADMLEQIQGLYNYYDPDYTPRLSFTTDRDLFPDLGGINPEIMFGTQLNVVLLVYSQGWGVNGGESSLLFFTQDPDGTFKWYGMVYGNFSN